MKARGYLTFWEMAGELAKKLHDDDWRTFHDDCFNEVNHDFWDRLFADGDDPKDVFSLTLGTRRPPMAITRELVWGILGINRPDAFDQYWDQKFPPWDDLAKVPTEDYGDGARNTLKNLCLSESDARDWIRIKAGDEAKPIPKTQGEAAGLRGELKKWIEKNSKQPDCATYTKRDFRSNARVKVPGGKKITIHLFDQVWGTADIPEKFKKPGRRRSTS